MPRIVLLTLAICGAIGVVVVCHREPVPRARLASGTKPPLPATASPRPVKTPSTLVAPASDDVGDEAAFMAMLRDEGLEDADGSLTLVREGDRRFPGSRHAAERAWFAVRALVNLGRMDEAVAASRRLVEMYPDDPFALDVARHMLTHPMRDPAEIGYARHP